MATTVAPSLHIAYKEWAYEPRTFAHCRENLRATQRWANDLHCLGGEFADGNPGLHFPYLDEITTDLDGGRLEQDYLALERFANATCAGLHIPYKEWLRLNPDDTYGPRKEQANLLAVERWAAGVGRCCVPAVVPLFFEPWYITTLYGGDIGPGEPPNYPMPAGSTWESSGPFDQPAHLTLFATSFTNTNPLHGIPWHARISVMRRRAGVWSEVFGADYVDYTGPGGSYHDGIDFSDIDFVVGDEVRFEVTDGDFVTIVPFDESGPPTCLLRFTAGPNPSFVDHPSVYSLATRPHEPRYTVRRPVDPTVERWNVFDVAATERLNDTTFNGSTFAYDSGYPGGLYAATGPSHSEPITMDTETTITHLMVFVAPGDTSHVAVTRWDGAAWVVLTEGDVSTPAFFTFGIWNALYFVPSGTPYLVLSAGDTIRVEVTSGTLAKFAYKLSFRTYTPNVTALPTHYSGVGFERYALRPWAP